MARLQINIFKILACQPKSQGTQRRERRDHGDQNGAHCGFCQLVPNWIQGWIIGCFFYNHPIVALCIWFSLFCGLRPTFTFHGGLQVSIFTFLGGNQLSTSNSGAGRRLCQSAQVTPWIQILENINFCLISMHISNYSFKY